MPPLSDSIAAPAGKMATEDVDDRASAPPPTSLFADPNEKTTTALLHDEGAASDDDDASEDDKELLEDPDYDPSELDEESNDDVDNAASGLGEEYMEDIDEEIPRASPVSTITANLSMGQDFAINLNGSNVSINIQYDSLGKIRIFNSGIEDFSAMTIQRSGTLDNFLFPRRLRQTFDFFGLPGEIRNQIYELVFKDAPENPEPQIYRLRRPQNPVKFFARLNKKATGGSGLPFINHQSLQETMVMFFRLKNFTLGGDKAAFAFLSSLGPHGRAVFKGPLRFAFYIWDKDKSAISKWPSLLAECKNLRELLFYSDFDDLDLDDGCPFYQLLLHGQGKLSSLERADSLTFWTKPMSAVFGMLVLPLLKRGTNEKDAIPLMFGKMVSIRAAGLR